MNRIAITGNSGSGKSTLAIRVGSALEIPVIHLDELYWLGEGRHVEDASFAEQLRETISAQRWITDGYHPATLPMLAQAADVVVLLDIAPWICVRRLLFARGKRPGVRWRGKRRPWRRHLGFLRWVAIYRTDRRPGVLQDLKPFADKLVVIRKPRDADRWLASLEGRS